MYFVYILHSLKLDKYYVGTTDDIEKRLTEHNSSIYIGSYTAKGVPWELVLKYSCLESDKAYKLERFIKRMKSSKFIKKVIENSDILDDICFNKL